MPAYSRLPPEVVKILCAQTTLPLGLPQGKSHSRLKGLLGEACPFNPSVEEAEAHRSLKVKASLLYIVSSSTAKIHRLCLKIFFL